MVVVLDRENMGKGIQMSREVGLAELWLVCKGESREVADQKWVNKEEVL